MDEMSNLPVFVGEKSPTSQDLPGLEQNNSARIRYLGGWELGPMIRANGRGKKFNA